MTERKYSSTAVPTTLTGGIGSGDTSVAVAAVTGWPSSYPYTVILDEGTASEELVTVTAAGGLTLTVTRGVDGTAAVAHLAGSAARHGFSARDLREPQQHIEASAAVHGITGSVVGTSDTQTLSNKTLTTPTVASFANATHDHSNSAGGGNIPQASVTGLAAKIVDYDAHVAATAVHGATGAVVGTTNTQTLTNKTLTSPVVNAPTLVLQQSASPTPTAEGDIRWDTDDNRLTVGDGSGTKVFSDDSVTAVHGATGAVVGTTNTQTLTNKTIDGDDNTLQDIPASAVKKAGWTAYTPTVGGGWGAGIIEGRYQRVGNIVHFVINWQPGAGHATTPPTLTLPLAVRASSVTDASYLFSAGLHQPGVYMFDGFGECSQGSSALSVMYRGGSYYRVPVTATAPHTWAAGAVFTVRGTYETDAA